MEYETEATVLGVGSIADRRKNYFSIDTDNGCWEVFFGGFNPPDLSRGELQKIQKTLIFIGWFCCKGYYIFFWPRNIPIRQLRIKNCFFV